MGVSMNDKAFYERRLQEELARAATEHDEKLKELHSVWAGLYAERLIKLSKPVDLAA